MQKYRMDKDFEDKLAGFQAFALMVRGAELVSSLSKGLKVRRAAHCKWPEGTGKAHLPVGLFLIDEALTRVLIKNQCDI